MTPADAMEFLIKARLLDNRIGDADAAKAVAWAGCLDDVPLDAALAALREHYRSNHDTINPGHIRPLMKIVKANWESQKRSIEAKRPKEIEPPREMSPETRALLEEARKKLGPGNPRALKISGSVDYLGDRASGGREPSRLGAAMGSFMKQLKA